MLDIDFNLDTCQSARLLSKRAARKNMRFIVAAFDISHFDKSLVKTLALSNMDAAFVTLDVFH